MSGSQQDYLLVQRVFDSIQFGLQILRVATLVYFVTTTIRYIKRTSGQNPDSLTYATFGCMSVQLLLQIGNQVPSMVKLTTGANIKFSRAFFQSLRVLGLVVQNSGLVANLTRWFTALPPFNSEQRNLLHKSIMMRNMYLTLAADLILHISILVLILVRVPGAQNASRLAQVLINLLLILGYAVVYRRLRRYLGDASEINETNRRTIWFFAFVVQYLVFQSLQLVSGLVSKLDAEDNAFDVVNEVF